MSPAFTKLQGQYLTFIAVYTRLHRRPPAEADIQAYFQVTPPSVHNMIVTLERRGLIFENAWGRSIDSGPRRRGAAPTAGVIRIVPLNICAFREFQAGAR
jgi:hypothetical protein